MSWSAPPGLGGRKRVAQGAVLKQGEGLYGALFELVISTSNPKRAMNNVA